MVVVVFVPMDTTASEINEEETFIETIFPWKMVFNSFTKKFVRLQWLESSFTKI